MRYYHSNQIVYEYLDEVWMKDARGKVLFWDKDHGEIITHSVTALRDNQGVE